MDVNRREPEMPKIDAERFSVGQMLLECICAAVVKIALVE
jgi:hypothetical protein